MDYHVPVLLDECIEGLNISPDGIYVDVTFGGGGHSKAILDKLTTGKLIAFDQDLDAAENAKNISPEKKDNFIFVRHNFKYFKNFLRYHGINQVDGILADLGVSSHHFDDAKRGFSFRFEANLDMRMNQNSDFSAAELIKTYTKEQLVEIFKTYGELKNAYKLSDIIIKNREEKEITTVQDLVEIIRPIIPKKIEHKFLAKVFQALRIEVNKEMEVLEQFLLHTSDIIKPEGRLVVLTYHSLEDRLVKNFIKKGKFKGDIEKDFYGNVLTPFDAVNRKIIIPDEEEIERNNRARSAKLRIAQRRG